MSTNIVYKAFDASTVALKGNNLIEASAGTGKTYSIAILVLRLIVEKELSINQILMVTFTKAAIAELQERVRAFIREALRAVQGQAIADKIIMQVIQQAQNEKDAEKVLQLLTDTVLLLDETEIMTIHSFCQQILNEFAFETKQLFGATLVEDKNEIIEAELNNFWRKYITTIDAELLNSIHFSTLRREIYQVIQDHLNGKKYAEYSDSKTYQLFQGTETEIKTEIENAKLALEEEKKSILNHISEHTESIEASLKTASKSEKRNTLIRLLSDPETFFAQSITDKVSQRVYQSIGEDLLESLNIFMRHVADFDTTVIGNIKSQMYCFAIQEIGHSIDDFMLRNNLLDYNSIILRLHKALTEKDNPSLVNAMRNKYKAVFVDEFQDTDKEQYEIFHTAFKEETILFLIGDPKQSIYAFRKADIYTYFQARENVGENVYNMDFNFRSSASMISGMNYFFEPTAGFDTFFFANEKDSIQYSPVQSPENNEKGILQKENIEEKPFSISYHKKKEDVIESLVQHISQLLTQEYYINKNGSLKKIQPQDIGILVSKNKNGIAIQEQLAKVNIPSVMVHDQKIFDTSEATSVSYVLEAILEPSNNSINRALLYGLTGWNKNEVLLLNEEIVIEKFQEYKLIWENDGIYPAIAKFILDFDIEKNNSLRAGGDRIQSNIIQLMELLNSMEHRKHLAPGELIAWLHRGIQGSLQKGDEYTMRIESDENAVKISTIHKSKGLEYKIVFAPDLDFTRSKLPHLFSTFRDPNTSEYKTKETARLTEEEENWVNIQQEQEYRRLLYVAITRSVYKCYILQNQAFKNSTLLTFLQAYTVPNKYMEVTDHSTDDSIAQYINEEKSIPSLDIIAENFALEDNNWGKYSFTSLSAHGLPSPKERMRDMDNNYDEFIFNKLRFGAMTGNLLHELLENIDFHDTKNWKEEVKKAIDRYLPQSDENLNNNILQLLQHVTHAQIKLAGIFQLNEILFHTRMSELEFDFPLHEFKVSQLLAFASTEKMLLVRSQEYQKIMGMMNGKIDLFFAYHGRYYILDWKSNYLGYLPKHYNKEAVLRAMNENNYHLQYLIYTVAVKRYLESRIPDFDYEKQFGGVIYIFLRGVRENSDNAIFTARPSLEKITGLERLLTPKKSMIQ